MHLDLVQESQTWNFLEFIHMQPELYSEKSVYPQREEKDIIEENPNKEGKQTVVIVGDII
jgi:hypothetical protein